MTDSDKTAREWNALTTPQRMERAEQEHRQRDQQTRVYIWESGETAIVSFGNRPYKARKLAKASLQLTDHALALLEKPPSFNTVIGEPMVLGALDD